MADHLAELYDAHAAWMYRYAVVVLADPIAAEDVVQQVFVKLAHSKPDLRLCKGPGRPRNERINNAEAYLRTAARNECYRILERRRREPPQIPPDAAALIVQPVTSSEDDAELAQALSAALRGIPGEQREIVHLKVYEGKTFQQIADLLGVSINTASSRYRYAIEKLRRLLEPRDEPGRKVKR